MPRVAAAKAAGNQPPSGCSQPCRRSVPTVVLCYCRNQAQNILYIEGNEKKKSRVFTASYCMQVAAPSDYVRDRRPPKTAERAQIVEVATFSKVRVTALLPEQQRDRKVVRAGVPRPGKVSCLAYQKERLFVGDSTFKLVNRQGN